MYNYHQRDGNKNTNYTVSVNVSVSVAAYVTSASSGNRAVKRVGVRLPTIT